ARGFLRAYPHAASRRRAGRSAQPLDRPHGVRALHQPRDGGGMSVPPAAPPEEEFTGTKPVEERHRLDETKLAAWLERNIEGFEGPLAITQFKGGQSNPTYRLDTPARAYVLRRKPFGKLLPSAHAVDREFRVISALHRAGFAVPRPYALCTEESVIG